MDILPQDYLRTIRGHHPTAIASLIVVTSETIGAIGHRTAWEVGRVGELSVVIDVWRSQGFNLDIPIGTKPERKVNLRESLPLN